MAKKNKSVRRRRKRRVLFGIELFVLLILVGGLFIYAKVNEKMNKLDIDTSSDEASKVEVNEAVVGSKTLKGFTNIALFGVDNRKEDVKSGQSDTTIIASINNDTKEVKLVSLYRDTYLNIGNDKYTKCNAAYNNGGPTQAMSMINTNLDLNITNYVAVNFKALATAIDCLGGLDVEMTYVELKNMNDYCVETSEVTGMDYEPIEMPEYPGDDKQESEILGSFHLNGVQATSYCRIRYTSGWDMRRTERQRYIISLIVEKAKKASLSTLNDIMDQVFPMIATDFSKSELIKLGMGILSYKLGETSGFPNSSLMGDEVKNAIGLDCVVPTTLETNVKALHQFLFGDQAYEPSDIVKQRSDYIAGHTGFGNSYVSDEQKALISDSGSSDYNSGDDYNDSGDSGESGNNYDNGYEGSGDDGSGGSSSGESGDGGGYNNEDDDYSE
ncbi:LCP family protein [Blautia sp. LMAG:75]|uniref:LCP family protein n=1 Tax=Blautia sp. LMAG:75 TaxID=1969171 RepID=UPI0025BBA424|nr:LCP family protein [Blautia sp. LMAG:75]